MARRSLLFVLILIPGIVLAQSQFAGKWQTRTSKLTGKSAITVNIAIVEGNVKGTVVLLDPHSEIEMPMVNLRLNKGALEFETTDRNDTFYWHLTMRGKRKGFLHGSMHEMLIDERVVKAR